VFLWVIAWLLSTDAPVFRGWLYDYQVLIYSLLAVSFLSFGTAMSAVDQEVDHEYREILKSLFVQGAVNSDFIYRDAEGFDQIFARIRKAITENTDINLYNQFYVWDFDELLTECLKDLRSDVDLNIRSESNREAPKESQ